MGLTALTVVPLKTPAPPAPEIVIPVPNTICPPESKDPPALEADWNTSLAKLARLSNTLPRQVDVPLLMPVDGVRVHDIWNTWGGARDSDRMHAGQDIFARPETYVRSATRGIVWRIGTSPNGGNYVYVLGGGGRRYYYAHLGRVSRNIGIGSKVNTKTILGTVGNSGNAKATPSHLHFAVFGAYDPKAECRFLAINPLPLLADR